MCTLFFTSIEIWGPNFSTSLLLLLFLNSSIELILTGMAVAHSVLSFISLMSNQVSFPVPIGCLYFLWEISTHILCEFFFNWEPITLAFNIIFTADFFLAKKWWKISHKWGMVIEVRHCWLRQDNEGERHYKKQTESLKKPKHSSSHRVSTTVSLGSDSFSRPQYGKSLRFTVITLILFIGSLSILYGLF